MYKIMTIFDAVDKVSTVASNVSKAIEGTGSTVARVGAGMTKLGDAMTIGITTPILGLGAAATKMAIDFDKAMMGVNSVLKLGGDEFAKYSDDVLEFSTKTSKSSVEVALALREIVSRGYNATEALDILKVSVDAAGNTMTDTETTTRALTSVLSAFGMEISSVTHVADVLEKASTSSAVSFEGLANNIGKVVGTAAAAGIAFEEVTAAMMTVTDAGFGVEEAGTAVNALITRLLDPTEDLAAAIGSWGYESGLAALQSEGLEGVMRLLMRTTGGNADAMVQLLGNIRASRAAFALSRDEGMAFADSLDEIAMASEGAGEHAALSAIRHESAAYMIAKMKSEFEVLFIRLANVGLPVLKDLVEQITDVATKLAQLPPETRENIIKFALLAAAIGPILSIGGRLIAFFTTIAPLLGALPGILSTATAGLQLYAGGATVAQVASLGLNAALIPLAVILGAVVLAAVAAVKIYKTYQQVQERNAQVANTWTRFLEDQEDAQRSATQVADEYVAAQQRVAAAHDAGGIVADVFVNRQRVLTSESETLQGTLMRTADTWSEYSAAVDKVNESNEALGLDQQIDTIDRWAFELEKATQLQNERLAEFRDRLFDGTESWEDFIDAAARANEELGTNVVVMDQWTSMFAVGAESATMSSAEIDEALGMVDEATLETIAISEELMRKQEEVWQSFSDSVRGGVERALGAYREGNTEMLAAQQEALAQMLWTQTDQMVMLGQITSEQAIGMKSAIAEQFGIMVDETQLTTDALLGMFGEWAAGGNVTAGQIVGFLNNIGAEADALASAEETSVMRSILAHEHRASAAEEAGERVVGQFARIDEMTTGTANTAESNAVTWGTTMTGMSSDMDTLASDVAGNSEQISARLENIRNAVNNLPARKQIDIVLNKIGDSEFDMRSPTFVLQGAVESLVAYAAANPVDVTIDSDDAEEFEKRVEEVTSAIDRLTGLGGKLSRLGGAFAEMLEDRTLDPLADRIEAIGDKLSEMPSVIVGKGSEVLRIFDEMYRLTAEKAEAEAEYARLQEKVAKFQQQQQEQDFLKQQVELLDMIREYGLDIDQVLGNVVLGRGADVEGLLDAMSRAMAGVLDQTEMALRQEEGLLRGGVGAIPFSNGQTTTQTTINYNLNYTGMPSNGQPGQMDAERAMREIEVAASVNR